MNFADFLGERGIQTLGDLYILEEDEVEIILNEVDDDGRGTIATLVEVAQHANTLRDSDDGPAALTRTFEVADLDTELKLIRAITIPHNKLSPIDVKPVKTDAASVDSEEEDVMTALHRACEELNSGYQAPGLHGFDVRAEAQTIILYVTANTSHAQFETICNAVRNTCGKIISSYRMVQEFHHDAHEVVRVISPMHAEFLVDIRGIGLQSKIGSCLFAREYDHYDHLDEKVSTIGLVVRIFDPDAAVDVQPVGVLTAAHANRRTGTVSTHSVALGRRQVAVHESLNLPIVGSVSVDMTVLRIRRESVPLSPNYIDSMGFRRMNGEVVRLSGLVTSMCRDTTPTIVRKYQHKDVFLAGCLRKVVGHIIGKFGDSRRGISALTCVFPPEVDQGDSGALVFAQTSANEFLALGIMSQKLTDGTYRVVPLHYLNEHIHLY